MSMNCEDARLMISILAEDDLPQSDKARLRAHLNGCVHCSAYQQDIDRIQSKLADCLLYTEDYGDITDIVMSQLPTPAPRPRLALKSAWLLVPGFCAIAVALVFANSMLKSPKPQQAKSTPAPQVKKHIAPNKPTNDTIAQTPLTSTPERMEQRGTGVTHHHQTPPTQDQPLQIPRELPQAPPAPIKTPIPVQPPVIASVPADDPQSPMPGRIHIAVPAASEHDLNRVPTSDPALYVPVDPPTTTTAYVCMDVPAVDGVKEVRLYSMPVQLPRRPVALAYNSQEEMLR